MDTWQWVLRLAPRADLALQIAALFHGDFPREHTRRELAHTLRRLRPHQRWRLARVRFAPQVRRLLEETLERASQDTPRELA